jgi:tetratricopeptide (TPR) repeat protein
METYTVEQLRNTALHAFAQKEYVKAEHLFSSLLHTHGDTMDAVEYQITQRDYAVCMLFAGNPQQAMATLNAVLDYFLKVKNQDQIGLTQGNLAAVHEFQKEYRLALDLYQKAATNINSVNCPDEYYHCLRACALINMRLFRIKPAVWAYFKAIESKPHPSFFDKFIRSMLKFGFGV